MQSNINSTTTKATTTDINTKLIQNLYSVSLDREDGIEIPVAYLKNANYQTGKLGWDKVVAFISQAILNFFANDKGSNPVCVRLIYGFLQQTTQCIWNLTNNDTKIELQVQNSGGVTPEALQQILIFGNYLSGSIQGNKFLISFDDQTLLQNFLKLANQYCDLKVGALDTKIQGQLQDLTDDLNAAFNDIDSAIRNIISNQIPNAITNFANNGGLYNANKNIFSNSGNVKFTFDDVNKKIIANTDGSVKVDAPSVIQTLKNNEFVDYSLSDNDTLINTDLTKTLNQAKTYTDTAKQELQDEINKITPFTVDEFVSSISPNSSIVASKDNDLLMMNDEVKSFSVYFYDKDTTITVDKSRNPILTIKKNFDLMQNINYLLINCNFRKSLLPAFNDVAKFNAYEITLKFVIQIQTNATDLNELKSLVENFFKKRIFVNIQYIAVIPEVTGYVNFDFRNFDSSIGYNGSIDIGNTLYGDIGKDSLEDDNCREYSCVNSNKRTGFLSYRSSGYPDTFNLTFEIEGNQASDSTSVFASYEDYKLLNIIQNISFLKDKTLILPHTNFLSNTSLSPLFAPKYAKFKRDIDIYTVQPIDNNRLCQYYFTPRKSLKSGSYADSVVTNDYLPEYPKSLIRGMNCITDFAIPENIIWYSQVLIADYSLTLVSWDPASWAPEPALWTGIKLTIFDLYTNPLQYITKDTTFHINLDVTTWCKFPSQQIEILISFETDSGMPKPFVVKTIMTNGTTETLALDEARVVTQKVQFSTKFNVATQTFTEVPFLSAYDFFKTDNFVNFIDPTSNIKVENKDNKILLTAPESKQRTLVQDFTYDIRKLRERQDITINLDTNALSSVDNVIINLVASTSMHDRPDSEYIDEVPNGQREDAIYLNVIFKIGDRIIDDLVGLNINIKYNFKVNNRYIKGVDSTYSFINSNNVVSNGQLFKIRLGHTKEYGYVNAGYVSSMGNIIAILKQDKTFLIDDIPDPTELAEYLDEAFYNNLQSTTSILQDTYVVFSRQPITNRKLKNPVYYSTTASGYQKSGELQSVKNEEFGCARMRLNYPGDASNESTVSFGYTGNENFTGKSFYRSSGIGVNTRDFLTCGKYLWLGFADIYCYGLSNNDYVELPDEKMIIANTHVNMPLNIDRTHTFFVNVRSWNRFTAKTIRLRIYVKDINDPSMTEPFVFEKTIQSASSTNINQRNNKLDVIKFSVKYDATTKTWTEVAFAEPYNYDAKILQSLLDAKTYTDTAINNAVKNITDKQIEYQTVTINSSLVKMTLEEQLQILNEINNDITPTPRAFDTTITVTMTKKYCILYLDLSYFATYGNIVPVRIFVHLYTSALTSFGDNTFELVPTLDKMTNQNAVSVSAFNNKFPTQSAPRIYCKDITRGIDLYAEYGAETEAKRENDFVIFNSELYANFEVCF